MAIFKQFRRLFLRRAADDGSEGGAATDYIVVESGPWLSEAEAANMPRAKPVGAPSLEIMLAPDISEVMSEGANSHLQPHS